MNLLTLKFGLKTRKALSIVLLLAYILQPMSVFADESGFNIAPSNPSISGPTVGEPGVSYTFSASATDPEGDQVSYGFDWDNNGAVDNYSGYVDSGSFASVSYSWAGTGTHTFSVVARDVWGQYSNPSYASITIAPVVVTPINTAPTSPSVSAPSTAFVNTSVSFTATAQDPQGDSLVYGFDWDDNGVIDGYTGYVSSGASAQLAHSWSAVGTYTVKAYARDIWGNLSNAASINITITSSGPVVVNTAPNIPFVIGSQTSTVNTSESFTVNSSDPQGDNLAYGVDWDNNGVVDEYTEFVTSGISGNVFHSWQTAGTYTFKVYAKDVWGAISQSASFTITITGQVTSPVNLAPSAPTLSSNGTAVNTNITFTAQSTDPENDQIDYGFDWDNNGVVDEYTGFVASGAAAQKSHVWSSIGTYTVKVYAKDAWGNFSNASSINITITTTGPVTVNTAPNVPFVLGNTAGLVSVAETFTVNAVDPQNDSLVYGFDWDNNGTIDDYTDTVASGISQTGSHTWTAPGVYTFKVYAQDVWNAVSNGAVFTITISSPVVNLAPANPSVTVSGSAVEMPISFTAVSTDPENDQIMYGFDWDNNGTIEEYSGLVASGVAAVLSHTWTTPGTYIVKVYAKDSFGNFSGATSVNVMVSGGVVTINTAPTTPSVTGPSVGLINTSYNFTITATDPEQNNVAYGVDWDNDGVVDGGYTGFVSSGTSLTVAHSFDTEGSKSFKVYAKDTFDAISSAYVFTIQISKPGPVHVNQPPVLSPVNGPVTGVVNTSYTFSATANDPEGDNISYAFDWNNDGVVGIASDEQWSDQVSSGTSISRSNSWSTSGAKTFQVFARDMEGAQSSISAQILINGGPTNENINFTISPVNGLSTSESGATAVFTVVLDSAPIAPVTFKVESTDLTEGTTAPLSEIIFTPSTWNISKTIIVTGVDDSVDDGDVTYSIVVGPAQSNDVNWNGFGAKAVSIVNTDNDETSGGGGNQNPGSISSFAANPATITSGQGSTLSWSSANATLCEASGAWSGTKALTGSEALGPFSTTTTTVLTFNLSCGNQFGTSSQSATLTINPVTGGGGSQTPFDFIISPTTGLVTTEAGATTTFSVVLSRAPNLAVTLPIVSSDTTEGTVSTTTLVFDTNNWNVHQVVTVTGVDDSSIDGNIAYSISVGASESAESVWNNLALKLVSVTNIDNDVTTPTTGGGGGGSSSGGGGSGGSGGGGGRCIGFNCPATTTPSVSPDVFILIDQAPTSGGVRTGVDNVCPSGNYLTTYMRIGRDNNPSEVRKLQIFLNTYEGANLAVTGIFDAATEQAVKDLQVSHSKEILSPWGVSEPTGIVYITTTRYINIVTCTDVIKDTGGIVPYEPATTTDDFSGAIGQATSSPDTSNLAAIFEALKDIPWYALLIILLIILGTGLILSGILRKDLLVEETYVTFIKGASILAIGSVLNVLNSLSFILNPKWFVDKTGLTLTWLLGLDIFNLIALIVICLVAAISLYTKSTDSKN